MFFKFRTLQWIFMRFVSINFSSSSEVKFKMIIIEVNKYCFKSSKYRRVFPLGYGLWWFIDEYLSRAVDKGRKPTYQKYIRSSCLSMLRAIIHVWHMKIMSSQYHHKTHCCISCEPLVSRSLVFKSTTTAILLTTSQCEYSTQVLEFHHSHPRSSLNI